MRSPPSLVLPPLPLLLSGIGEVDEDVPGVGRALTREAPNGLGAVAAS